MKDAQRVLIVGGSPERSSVRTLAAAAKTCDRVVAVDRGLDAVCEAGLACDLFCGDADTVSPAALERLERARGVEGGRIPDIERYDPYKDFTDLSLALRAIGERWPGADVVCVNVSGGAPDHFLGALGCLVAYRGGTVNIVEDAFEARILHGADADGARQTDCEHEARELAAAELANCENTSCDSAAGEQLTRKNVACELAAGEVVACERAASALSGDAWQIDDAVGSRFSVVALSQPAIVSERGFEWEIDHAELPLLGDRGVSNVVVAEHAQVACHAGCAVAYLFRKNN